MIRWAMRDSLPTLLATVAIGGLLLVGGACDAPPTTVKTREADSAKENAVVAAPAVHSDPEVAASGEAFEVGSGSVSSRASALDRSASEAVPPIRLAPGLEVDRAAGELRLAAQSALDAGWLEQAICLAGTREHESLLVVDTPPRLIHAGLLMLGLEPGRPGRWRVDEATGGVVREAPRGPRLEIRLRYRHPRRGEVEEPLSAWFLGRDGELGPAHPWRFAGSLEERDETRTNYLADFSGSVAGLVTFGDEVIAHEEVLADRIDVEHEPFRVAEQVVPPPGTPISVVIRPAR